MFLHELNDKKKDSFSLLCINFKFCICKSQLTICLSSNIINPFEELFYFDLILVMSSWKEVDK